MLTIANPIYDTVFKYLMEDERIARTILSALLKENIVKVEVRPHEYVNGQKESMSIFRIDFGATILKDNGDEQLILIELQKTWLPTETLRFRQYLGVHYQNPKNMVSDSPDRHALPMVAVYLLGHTVGDIVEPVVYVRHQAFDYNDEPVVRGIPDKFVDSLNHNSIIVQIPRLHGKINNRLDKVLSIFDQTRVNEDNQHYLNLDDHTVDSADEDMQPIFHRLIMAAANIEMRQDMNVEDEYYSIIKEQEGKVFGLEKEMAEVKGELDATKGQLDATKGQLDATKGQLDATKGQLDETKGQLDATKGQLDATKGQLDATKGQLDATKGQLDETKGELDATKGQLDETKGELDATKGQLDETKGQLQKLVKMLLQSGQSIEAVAKSLNIDTEAARALI